MTLAASTLAIASALLIGAAGCELRAAQEGTSRPKEIDTPRSVAGELIVKLTPEAGEVLDAALQAEAAPTHTGLPGLDELNQRYGVTAIEPVFAHQPDLDAIKRKYPELDVLVEPGAPTQAEPLSSVRDQHIPVDAAIVVGPEGGWRDAEWSAARQRGVRLVTLGHRTLRADAVPVAAISVLQFLWGDL